MTKILIDEEVVKQVLTTLEGSHPSFGIHTEMWSKSVTALRSALDDVENVEPVAWVKLNDESDFTFQKPMHEGGYQKLYAAPQKDQLNNLVEAVLAVCCDPEGRVVIRGSDGDRAVLQEALAKVGAGRTVKVTKQMIGAAHDVMLAKGDFVLSANLLERIYLAMDQAAPPPQTPFDTCPTCEALARTVMMDQTGSA